MELCFQMRAIYGVTTYPEFLPFLGYDTTSKPRLGFSMVIDVQQWQLNDERLKDANAVITLLEK